MFRKKSEADKSIFVEVCDQKTGKIPGAFFSSYELKESDYEKRIYQGFSGIHYAIAYDNMHLLREGLKLIEKEKHLDKYCFFVNPGSHLKIPSKIRPAMKCINVFGGACPLTLALVFDNEQAARMLIDFYQTH